jgi:fibronectin type 3 domain-containing protein
VTGCGNKSSTRNYTVTIQPAAVHTVTLTWNESDTSVVGYNMYRGTTSGGTYTKVNTGGLIAAMLYTDSTVANGTTYYYVVTAVDNTGAESAYSNQAQATIPN